ncbi:MAG: hypothetical protein ABI574_17880 [Burkholderiales bacterium]
MMRRLIVAVICGLGMVMAVANGSPSVITPAEHRRTPDQTFLTFPEWYLVHSPAEYAQYLATAQHPSAFPLFAHIGQFWQSYAAVNRELAPYPFNGGYHLMVMVIGTSTTVEYALKGAYEHTVGRLAEATRSGALVAEERFAGRYAQSYVDFIRVDPWYLYDFWGQLKQLWQDVPLRGPDLLRRWERRFALSSELLVKAGYGRLIKLGTQTIYDAPKPTTAVVLNKAPTADTKHPELVLLDAVRPDGSVLATVPRYEGFTTTSRWLAAQGVDFVEIAGNRGDVLVSLLVPTAWRPGSERLLFEQPLLTQPGRKRVAIAVPVAALAATLRQAAAQPGTVVVEHVYDF